VLDDGTYEGIVVDVAMADRVVLCVAIVSGPRRGDVVDVRAAAMHDDAVDLLGMPCVLSVHEGEPSVVFD
jgi:hypothetical protein